MVVLSNDSYNKRFEDFAASPSHNKFEIEGLILIKDRNLENRRLIVDSIIKVDGIFSVNKKLVRKNIGKINKETYNNSRKYW